MTQKERPKIKISKAKQKQKKRISWTNKMHTLSSITSTDIWHVYWQYWREREREWASERVNEPNGKWMKKQKQKNKYIFYLLIVVFERSRDQLTTFTGVYSNNQKKWLFWLLLDALTPNELCVCARAQKQEKWHNDDQNKMQDFYFISVFCVCSAVFICRSFG